MDSAASGIVPRCHDNRIAIDMMPMLAGAGAAGLGPATGAVFGAVLGAVIGSFLATVLLRWARGEQASGGRSRCDACGVPLGARSLVPVLSFAWQRGRCRACGARIPRAHLIMEVASAAIGATCGVLLADRPGEAVAGAVLGWALLLLAALDFTRFWLPDRLTLPLAAAGIGAAGLGLGVDGGPDGGLVAAGIGLVGGYGALTLVGWSYRRLRGREGLGGGDPKLFGAIGAWLGWAALPQVLLAAAGLGLGAAALMVVAGRKPAATTRLPLGTLLAAAAWPLWLAGHAA